LEYQNKNGLCVHIENVAMNKKRCSTKQEQKSTSRQATSGIVQDQENGCVTRDFGAQEDTMGRSLSKEACWMWNDLE